MKNESNFIPFESVDSVKVTAPLDHEIQNLIRSKADYAGSLQIKVPSIVGVNWRAVTPTYTQISYLKSDNTLLTETETEDFLSILREENYFGTPLPDITSPRREVAYLQIDIALTNKYKNTADIDEDVTNIIKNSYEESLGATFNVYDLERRIEALSYVKYARVSHVLNSRSSSKQYQLGYILYHNDNFYMATKILGISGDAVPNWGLTIADNNKKEIDLGHPPIVDGSLKWKAYKRLPNMDDELQLWTQNTPYGIGDFVYDPAYDNFMFKCVDIIRSSGTSFPSVGLVEEGDFIQDGSIVWVVTKYNSDNPIWQPLTNYSLGSEVNVANVAGYSLQCISYTGGTSSNPDLEFEDGTYPIISVNDVNKTFTIAGNKTFYFKAGDIIEIEDTQTSTPGTVASSVYDEDNNQTIITIFQEVSPNKTYVNLVTEIKGTRDGQILWSLVDNVDEIKYEWNAYVTFEHKLNVLEN